MRRLAFRPLIAAFLAAALVAVGVGAGCAAHRTGDAVRSVHFEGNDRHGNGGLLAPQSDRALRNAMKQPVSSWTAFLAPGTVEPIWVDRALLDADGQRLEVWYANHGYFDAHFLGWQLEGRPTRPRRRVHPVDVVGYVDQGEPSRVVSVEIEGMKPLLEATRRRIRDLVLLAPGDVFDRDAYRESAATIESLLRTSSYAYASVTGEVEVHPDTHEVFVRYLVTPGLVCTFGAVNFTGRPGIDTDLLDRLVTIKEGGAFSTKPIAATRANLFALKVFSVVNVIPDLSDPTRASVPVRIELRSAPSTEVQAGPAFTLEPGRQQLAASVRYNDYDVARRLWRWENEANLGVATLVDSVGALGSLDPRTDIAPVVSLDSKLTMPRLTADLTLTNHFAIALDAKPGYRVLSPSYNPALSWAGIPHFTPSIGYRLQYIDYFTETFETDVVKASLPCTESPFGDRVIDPGLLSLVEQGASYDSRDDPVEPHHGTYWSVGFAEAGVGGDYSFFRASGEVRHFIGVAPRKVEDFILAGRLGAGVILPFGDSAHARVPWVERFYLGGSTTVRGWAADTLGPTGGAEECPTEVPTGGKMMVYANFEPRLRLYGNLLGAVFVDAGRVWDSVDQFDPAGVQVSAGGGLRYLTAVGPLRVDFAYVLNQAEAFSALTPWALHFGLSEAF